MSRTLQWKALLRKNNLVDKAPDKLEEVVHHLQKFVMPILDYPTTGEMLWQAKGPWQKM